MVKLQDASSAFRARMRLKGALVGLVCAGLALGSCATPSPANGPASDSSAPATATPTATPTPTSAPSLTATSSERQVCELIAKQMPKLRDGEPGIWTGLSDLASGGGGGDSIIYAGLLTLTLQVSEAAVNAPVIGNQLDHLGEAMRDATDMEFISDSEAGAIGTAMTDALLACYNTDILEAPQARPKQAAKQVAWLTYGIPVKTAFCSALRSTLWSGLSDAIQKATSDKSQQQNAAALYSAYAIYSCPQMIPRAAEISATVTS